MRAIRLLSTAILLLFAVQTMAVAQSANLTETLKKHFNVTVQQVHQADDADEKRTILNDSFTKMIVSLDRIESLANLSDTEKSLIDSYRNDLIDKVSELNGLDGFNQVDDVDLDDFSSYSQDFLEQANNTTITIGVTTAILIIILLLLL